MTEQNIAIFGQTLTRVKSDERHLLYLLLQPHICPTVVQHNQFVVQILSVFLGEIFSCECVTGVECWTSWLSLSWAPYKVTHTEECGLWRQVADVWVEILLTTWVTSCSWPVDDGGYLKIIMKTASLRSLACWLLSEKFSSKGNTAVIEPSWRIWWKLKSIVVKL